MTPKGKFYVVWKGRRAGIFTSWESCAAQVNAFPDARYKAFATRSEAERAFARDYEAYAGRPASSQKWLFAPRPPVAESYVVDAACSGSPGRLEWRGVHLASGKELFREGPFRRGTNNVGEFLAIVHALVLLKKKNSCFLSIPIRRQPLPGSGPACARQLSAGTGRVPPCSTCSPRPNPGWRSIRSGTRSSSGIPRPGEKFRPISTANNLAGREIISFFFPPVLESLYFLRWRSSQWQRWLKCLLTAFGSA